MSVGDVNSNARGSGARYNDGKPHLELIPLQLIAQSFEILRPTSDHFVPMREALRHLGRFQERGGADVLQLAVRALDFDGEAWNECAAVFDYGRRKYAEWNWAKGMAWSVPIGCAARHALAVLTTGELDDPESGLRHRGHFMCNLTMLATYARMFPEGDDRPSQVFQPHAGSAR